MRKAVAKRAKKVGVKTVAAKRAKKVRVITKHPPIRVRKMAEEKLSVSKRKKRGSQLKRKRKPLKKPQETLAAKTMKLPGGGSMDFVYCPAGTYEMGSHIFGPMGIEVQRKITFWKGFWIGRYPVTQDQWNSVMGGEVLPSEELRLPKTNVSWCDCKKFIAKINALQSELQFALPSEAHWEYACRAGEIDEFRGNLREVAWYAKNSGGQTHVVGGKKPNRWGVCDMLGNVWEWCEDSFEGYQRSDLSNVMERRVNRGGSCLDDAEYCNPSYRNVGDPHDCGNNVGFRLMILSNIDDGIGAMIERVRNVIVERLGVDKAQVTVGASFVNDLGVDSLDALDLLMGLEEEFGVAICEKDATHFKCVGDVVSYLLEKGCFAVH